MMRLGMIVIVAAVLWLGMARPVWAQCEGTLDFGACEREQVRAAGALELANAQAQADATVAAAQVEATRLVEAAKQVQYQSQAEADTAIALAEAEAQRVIAAANAQAYQLVELARAQSDRLIAESSSQAMVLAEREATARIGILSGVSERNAVTWSMAGVVVSVVLALAYVLRPARAVVQQPPMPAQLPAPPALVQLAARRVGEETGLVAWCAPGRDGRWKVYTAAGAVPVAELRRLTVREDS